MHRLEIIGFVVILIGCALAFIPWGSLPGHVLPIVVVIIGGAVLLHGQTIHHREIRDELGIKD